MKLAVLTPNVTALAQPSVEDVAELAERGYRSIVSNRPENETEDQPSWLDLKAAAAAKNMDAIQIPVVMGQISEDQVEAFRNALEDLPRPIAVFCRTGTRAALMWA
jgi:sulfide:quinone oxidoreductase